MAMDDLDTGWDETPADAAPPAPKAAPTMPSPARAPMPPLARPVSYAPPANRPVRAPLSSPLPPPTYARLTSQVTMTAAHAEARANANYDSEAPISAPVSSGIVAVTSPELATALEEADFFIAQGLITDARTLLLEQLLRAPRHPALVARLARISSGPASTRARVG